MVHVKMSSEGATLMQRDLSLCRPAESGDGRPGSFGKRAGAIPGRRWIRHEVMPDAKITHRMGRRRTSRQNRRRGRADLSPGDQRVWAIRS